ncbi:hypothetical protein Tco_0448592 [Tanacetum coccineum]
MGYNKSPVFMYRRFDMVLNPPWNLPFLGAKGLTSPEQTATVDIGRTPSGGKELNTPEVNGNVKRHSKSIRIFNDSPLTGVNIPGSDENRLKLYDL